MTVCFTGHRDIPTERIEPLQRLLMEQLEGLYREGARHFIAGGALGFDTLCETCVIALRHLHPDIKLTLALPCREQDKKWSDVEKLCLYNIKIMADDVIYVSENYYPGCMMKRNKYMVDNSDVCVCYKDARIKGGTYNTFVYAHDRNKRIINTYELLKK